MGKVVKYTGSKLLGEELRRLRGARTYEEITQLSRSAGLKGRINPLSAPTLCQIESGQTMPSLPTLHALSVVYRVSAQHLLNLLVEERLMSAATLPATMEETDAAHQAALREGRWADDLALCIHGERLSQTAVQRLGWRARRGTCLHRLGMRDEAIAVLMDCLESRELTIDQRLMTLHGLVGALLSAGRVRLAATLLRTIDPAMLVQASDAMRRHYLTRRAHVAVELHEEGVEKGADGLRAALADLEAARAAWPAGETGSRRLLDAGMAYVRYCLGDVAAAGRDLEPLLAQCESATDEYGESLVRIYLSLIAQRNGQHESAVEHLEQAGSVAFRGGHHDLAFDAYVRLLLAARGQSDSRERRYSRRCLHLHPLVSELSRAGREFERMLGVRA
jgi:tetratricopeptide (TPR) repeat protein